MKKLFALIFALSVLSASCATAPVKVADAPPVQAASAEPIGQRFILKNGMTLLVKENRALPVVTVNMIIKAGAVNEPPEKAGLAHITAGLLTKGAGGKSASDISEAIEFVGGSLSVGGGGDYATASLTTLKKDADVGFYLLGLALTKPDFDQEEIGRMKSTVKAGIIRGEQDPGTVASKAFNKAMFGGRHPYGWPGVGTVDTVDSITRDDIVAFHKKHFIPNNAIVAVVGDVTEEEVKALLFRHMGGWRAGEVSETSFPEPPAPNGLEYITIDRDITQASILMGHRGVNRENPDYYSLLVMNYALGGGGFASRILDKIRDDMGLAYSAYSYFSPSKYDGMYVVGMETKSESVKLAIQETLKLVEEMREDGVTDQELQDAKDYITGSFPRRQDTNSKIAGLLTQVEYYNLGLDYFDMYEREVKKVTKEDVLRVARQYLHPDDIYIVVVADLDAVGLEPTEEAEGEVGSEQSISE
jgi:zinc protease